jgi:hypothetical protein
MNMKDHTKDAIETTDLEAVSGGQGIELGFQGLVNNLLNRANDAETKAVTDNLRKHGAIIG